MTTAQKVIKGFAIALAIILIVGMLSGAVTIVFTLVGVTDIVNWVGNMETYSLDGDIKSIDIDISAADFEIKTGETFSLESNIKNLTVQEKNGKLSVRQQSATLFGLNGISPGNNGEDASFVLTVPEDTIFKEIKINMGAGSFAATQLVCEKAELSFGAGETIIHYLEVTKFADIDGGAGNISVNGGNVAELDFDMGVGKLNFRSRVGDNSEFDLGIGQSNITLIGNKDDYRIKVSKGIGSITVDGLSLSDGSLSGSGSNELDISGGIGAVKLEFEEQ